MYEQDSSLAEELARRINSIEFQPSKGFLKDQRATQAVQLAAKPSLPAVAARVVLRCVVISAEPRGSSGADDAEDLPSACDEITAAGREIVHSLDAGIEHPLLQRRWIAGSQLQPRTATRVLFIECIGCELDAERAAARKAEREDGLGTPWNR